MFNYNSATKNYLFRVNPIIAIFVALIMSFFLFLPLNILNIILVFILVIYLSLQGLYKEGIRNFIIYCALYALMYYLVNFHVNYGHNFKFLFVFILRLYPLIMAVKMVKSYLPKEIVSTLASIKVPRSIILSFIVMVRFMPTLHFEFRQIIDSMHLRNLSFRSGYGFIHPFKTIRNILVPLLFRCLKISEELGTAAMFRGIDAPVERTELEKRKLGFIDYFMSFIFLAFFVFCIIYKTDFLFIPYLM